MRHTASRTRRAAGLLGAGLVTGAVLTGCGSDETATAPAAATGPATAAAPAADTATPDLADGLLPATAFGPDATVIPVPADRLDRAGDLAGALAFVQVTPDSCATALREALPQVAAVSEAAAEVARSGDTVTAELLARPAGADAVGQFTTLSQACASAQVSAGEHGEGTVTVTPLGLPALAGGVPAAAVSVAVEATGPDGQAWSGTALAAVVQDGDRVLALAQAAPSGGAVDPATFTDLLQQAVDAQNALD
ncbi:hypothetical protein [Geodermatophilus sp. URMC 64]